MKIRLRACSLLAALFLSSCSTPSHLAFYQSSVVGADVAADTSTGQVHVALGYDRQTNALVPKSTVTGHDANGQPDQTEKSEAMSTLSASKVGIKSFGAHEVDEQFATGAAAVNIAAHPDAVATLSTLTEVEKEGN